MFRQKLYFLNSDVFDWNALNAKFKELPQTTAPAGYKCPTCSGPVFPADKQAGPVVDALREKLKVKLRNDTLKNDYTV